MSGPGFLMGYAADSTAAAPPQQQGSTFNDYMQALRAGASGVGADVAAGMRYLGDLGGNPDDPNAPANVAQDLFNLDQMRAQESMSDEARQQLAAGVTDPAFWEHPLNSTFLKLVNMGPMMAAAIGSTALGPEGPGAVIMGSLGGGALNAAAGINDIYQATDRMSDAELKRTNAYYRALRDGGIDEGEARSELNLNIQKLSPLFNFLAGGAAMAAGPIGKFAGLPLGTTGAGLLRRVTTGALEAGAGMGLQSGVSEATRESSLSALDSTKMFDPYQIAQATLEGGLQGLGLGAVGGVMPHGQQVVDVKGGEAATNLALSSDANPDAAGVPIVPPKPGAPAAGAAAQAAGEAQAAQAARAAKEASATAAAGRATGAATAGTGAAEAPAPKQGPAPTTSTGGAQSASMGQESAADAGKVPGRPGQVDPRAQAAATQAAADMAARQTQVKAAEAPTVPGAADVTQAGNVADAAAAAADDTGKTAPLPPSDLAAQRQALIDGKIPAMFYSRAELDNARTAGKPVTIPDKMKSASVKGGIVHFNPDKISFKTIMEANKANRLNEVLGIGPFNKADVAARVAAGEPAVATVARDAQGNEIKSAVGTPSTQPAQEAAIRETVPDATITKGPAGPELAARQAQEAAERTAGTPMAPAKKGEIPVAKEEKPPTKGKGKKAAAAKPAEPVEDVRKPQEGTMLTKEGKRVIRVVPPEVQAALDRHNAELAKRREEIAAATGKTEVQRATEETKAKAAEDLRKAGKSEDEIKKALTEGEGQKISHEERARRADVNATAEKIVEEHKPGEGERAYRGSGDNALKSRAAILDRARAMLKEAEDAGIKIPKSIRLTKDKSAQYNNAVTILKAAESLIKKTEEGKRPSTADFDRFLVQEAESRGGTLADKESVVRQRSEEGARKLGKETTKGEVGGEEAQKAAEAAAAEETYQPGAGEDIEGEEGEEGGEGEGEAAPEAGGKAGGEEAKGKEAKGEEAAGAGERGAASERAGAERAAAAGERTDAERAAAERADTGGEGAYSTPVKEGAKKPEVVVSRRRITRSGNKLVLKAEPDSAARKADAVKEREVRAEELNATPKVSTYTFEREINRARTDINDPKAKLDAYIAQRLKKLVGHIKVNVITNADMKRLMGERGVGGFYSAATDEIYISQKYLGDPDTYQHILQHEALHAALKHLIDTDPEAKQVIRQMMGDLAQHLIAKEGLLPTDVADVYGMKDEHEFISEVMSNPAWLETMADYKASPEVTHAVGVYGKAISMARAFINFVRQKLGLPNTARYTTQLENAFKLTNFLLDKTEAMGRDFLRDQAEQAWLQQKSEPARELAVKMEDDPLNTMFRKTLGENLRGGAEGTKAIIKAATEPAQYMTTLARITRAIGRFGDWVIKHLTTNDQFANNPLVRKLVPMARNVFDTIEKIGVRANELKKPGQQLNAVLIRLGKKYPGLAAEFADLINLQTMHGVDASAALGEGYNAHLKNSQAIQAKIDKGIPVTDLEHDMAMNSWQARQNYPALKARYDALVRKAPELAGLQKKLFDYYRDTQASMAREKIDSILRNYGYDGADRADLADRVYQGKFNEDFRKELADKVGESGAKALENATALHVKNGPYAPLMRHGTHAIIGEYKITEPGNAINKVDDNTWEFKNREDALNFAKKTGLNYKAKTVYYDDQGKRVTKEDVSATSEPEQRIQVKVDNQHLEFHDHEESRNAAYEELKNTGLFSKLGKEERKNLITENSEFTDRGTQSLLKNLEQQERYQNAGTAEKKAMRDAIVDAGLRHQTDNRVQSRRLPRRGIKGASTDLAQNLMLYNESQANYRARAAFQPELNKHMEAMNEHVDKNRYTPDNERRRAIANEVERRVAATDPNDFTGAWPEWTRRLMMYSYVDRMVRASHLILHQTHLPMISAPFMAGRHGVLKTGGQLIKNWRLLSGAYKAGGKDFMQSISDALHNGTDYGHLFDELVKGEKDGGRLSDMFSTLESTGILHPQAGIEVGKFLPAKQLSGPAGVLDRSMQHVDTMFRHLTNATEAINRYVGATTAYRLEFEKLTRAGKSAADAHEGAVEYARKVVTETQGLYSPTNAAPLFKNPFLRPFLQFKQFPQMMYSMLSRLAVQSLKGESKAVKVEAMKSLAMILGSHVAMAGVLQGLPLEPFKALAWTAKRIGLSSGDWDDVEKSVRQHLVDNFGNGFATDVLTHGLGSAVFGVDLHHRLGLNSFVTYGMPEKMDNGSLAQFILGAVGGAPESLIADTLGGISKMAQGDIEGGALQAVPWQALRDIHTAAFGGAKKSGYEPTTADRLKRAIGFTPAADAEARDRQEAVYNAVTSFSQKRQELIKEWVGADPAERNEIWQGIQRWNQDKPIDGRINMGALLKAQAAAKKRAIPGVGNIAGVPVSRTTRDIAEQTAQYY